VGALLSLSLPLLCGVWAAALVPSYALPGNLILGWTLIALGIIDARTFVLPDCLTLPLAAAGVAYSVWINSPPPSSAGEYALQATFSVAAAAAGFLFMALVARTFKAVRGIEGLGLGDAKLLAVAGAWLGLAALPSIVLLASVTALALTVLVRALRKGGGVAGTTPIPFGPYLAASTWIVALYGPLGFS
jgi:leader peptidase (prepilin peptidase) / N-methyltransferase